MKFFYNSLSKMFLLLLVLKQVIIFFCFSETSKRFSSNEKFLNPTKMIKQTNLLLLQSCIYVFINEDPCLSLSFVCHFNLQTDLLARMLFFFLCFSFGMIYRFPCSSFNRNIMCTLYAISFCLKCMVLILSLKCSSLSELCIEITYSFN